MTAKATAAALRQVPAQFTDIVVSGDEQCAKPDARIYEIAEQRFGVAPQALFFTDDNPHNIAAARARGWQAHLFDGADGLERAVVQAGLLEPAQD